MIKRGGKIMRTKILAIVVLLISICLITGFFLLSAPSGNWIIDPNLNRINQEVYSPRYPRSDFEYHSPSNPSNANPNNGAVFTGNYSVYGVDSDGDGVYNFLTINAEVNVTTTGNYSIFGALKSSNTHITSRGSKYSTTPSGYALLASDPGLINVILNFSGEDIHSSGINGVYTVNLSILDENGFIIDNKSFDTSAYSYTEFGEIPAALISSTDYGRNKILSLTIGAVILICLAAGLFFLLKKMRC